MNGFQVMDYTNDNDEKVSPRKKREATCAYPLSLNSYSLLLSLIMNHFLEAEPTCTPTYCMYVYQFLHFLANTWYYQTIYFATLIWRNKISF